jgi:hypothetical protein
MAVAHNGHVSRAAARLNLSQPTARLQLTTLAELTGLPLFTRTTSCSGASSAWLRSPACHQNGWRWWTRRRRCWTS